MQTSRKHGMIMMNDGLVDLVKRDLVTAEEAYLKAIDKQSLLVQFKNAGIPPPNFPNQTS